MNHLTKTFLLFLCLAGPSSYGTLLPFDTLSSLKKLRVLVDHTELRLFEKERSLVSELIMDLIESCSEDSSAKFANESNWNRHIKNNAIYLAFKKPQVIYTKTQIINNVSEVLIPFPNGGWNNHVLMRSGKSLLSYTKSSRKTAARLVCGEPLNLVWKSPFSSGPWKDNCEGLLKAR